MAGEQMISFREAQVKFDTSNLTALFGYINREVFGGKLIMPKIVAINRNIKGHYATFIYDRGNGNPAIYVYNEFGPGQEPDPEEWMYDLSHEIAHYYLWDKYVKRFTGKFWKGEEGKEFEKKVEDRVEHTPEFAAVTNKILEKLKLKQEKRIRKRDTDMLEHGTSTLLFDEDEVINAMKHNDVNKIKRIIPSLEPKDQKMLSEILHQYETNPSISMYDNLQERAKNHPPISSRRADLLEKLNPIEFVVQIQFVEEGKVNFKGVMFRTERSEDGYKKLRYLREFVDQKLKFIEAHTVGEQNIKNAIMSELRNNPKLSDVEPMKNSSKSITLFEIGVTVK